ncbi:MAG: TetR/AcrR family transcriptional regulator C-terminal domain-containing protein [Rhodoglobus sp.]
MDEEQNDLDLPRGVALAWGVAANPQRGPKREMSIERIVEIAIEIADASGLGAVSMSSVATRLGFTTMALYRYVTAKDDLLLLMSEHGVGMPPLSITESADWRSGLTAWSREVLAVFAAHPWLLDIPISSMPNTPNNLAWLEAGLDVLEKTPLDWQERVSCVLLLNGQARWQGNIQRGYAQAGNTMNGELSETDRASAHILATFVTPEAFPVLSRAVTAGVFEDDDNPFEFGLARILDGIEYYMASAGSRAPDPEPVVDEFRRDEGVKRAREVVKDAESRLREARKKEREAIKKAEERAKKQAEADARAAAKR